MNRREALFSLGAITASVAVAPKVGAKEIKGFPHETAMNAEQLPHPIKAGQYQAITEESDRQTLAAVFDRLIPADEFGPSATQAGCLEFLDAQLAGDYGAGKALYLEAPLNRENEEEMFGRPQFLATPRERYETGLKGLRAFAKAHYGKPFSELSADQIDELLSGMEAGKVNLGSDIDSQAFFELMLQNAREGYLADPIYGGNRNMAGWKMVGFPGARYDYRPYIERRNQDLGLIPVSLIPAD